MQNVEFKAELRDLEAARLQCKTCGAHRIAELDQSDTYFRLADGRLKRRETKGNPNEWIFYHRPDYARARISTYTILTDEQARRRWGTARLQPWLTVHKKRELWMLEHVRIHLDEVERLGRFIEFEAIVSKLFGIDACGAEIARLRKRFEPVTGELISVSYSDLLEQALEMEKGSRV